MSRNRIPGDLFHLAVPVKDLAEAREFYANKLGCRLAREYEDRITLDFFSHQLVCHLSPENIDRAPRMYPRHFGITFRERADFDAMWKRAVDRKLNVFCEPMVRFEGMAEEHETFFLVDPSNNLVEFKHYMIEEMMY